MRRTFAFRALAIAALLVPVIAGCGKIKALNAPAVKSGNADFHRYVAIGTSISAGYESGGLVVHHQQKSFVVGFAQQAGAGAGDPTATFEIPSVSPDGIPPLLQLVSLSPPIITNVGRTPGAPTNLTLPRPYNNLAVPGAVLPDVTSPARYATGAFPLVVRNLPGTILDQVALLQPTFVTFEMGANEVLGPATSGSGTPILNVPTFGGLLHNTLDSLELVAPNVKGAIFTVPDITSIPFFTTFSPIALSGLGAPSPLIGPSGPLTPGDYVLLTAGDSLAIGTGFAVGTPSYLTGAPGNGRPLPAGTVLDAASATTIRAAVDGYNAAIGTEASTRGWALVDLHGLLQQAATTGFQYQGTTYTNAFVTGGLFSLDGVHPTDLAHGIILNALIDAVNRTYQSGIPPANLSNYATATSSRITLAKGARPWVTHEDLVIRDIFGAPEMAARP
jgi:hypothetical protein